MREEIFKHPIWRQPEMGQFATMIEDMVTQTYYHSRVEWLASAPCCSGPKSRARDSHPISRWLRSRPSRLPDSTRRGVRGVPGAPRRAMGCSGGPSRASTHEGRTMGSLAKFSSGSTSFKDPLIFGCPRNKRIKRGGKRFRKESEGADKMGTSL
jgi:hypothetical protein